MARLKSLTTKSLFRFFIFTVIILLCCFPLLYILMENKYAEDLDDLIRFRSKEFIKQKLPSFTVHDIAQWNKYNEDLYILAFDEDQPLGIVRQEEYFNQSEGHDIDYRILYSEIIIEGNKYILASRVPMIEPGDLYSMLLTQYGILFAILLISLSIVYIIVSRRMWKPFYHTLQKMEQFNLASGKEPEFGSTDVKEFVNLNEQLSKLIRENLKIYRQQKEFVENASHELQTPLSVFQSQIDMLLQQPDLTETETNIIQSLYSSSSRMARLNKNLLLLAKIDNEQFQQRETVDLAAVLFEQLAPLKERADSEGIVLVVEEINPLIISANLILLESLINNLIVNAIRHNVKDVGIIIIILKDNVLSVSNTGQFEPLNPDKIFRRFSRTSEEKKGNGLGLSIVRQICLLHQWKIRYEYRGNKHCFSVVFSDAN
ncbi:HAMP domain-containing sensor histidine kinase [Proteiniphilum sp.]|uniref:sensor histidine kinase n=1 Tax=Proteiniphilum sp. TaxID=1926877 RepID=UPI002B1F4C30|nr:HAMP domain-containing sensor histidine kinase [Proteiniphilum sp.]MEA4916888.1 HAMP domain-containing sensor histidine kinase [Proteiniphilum sp.]